MMTLDLSLPVQGSICAAMAGDNYFVDWLTLFDGPFEQFLDIHHFPTVLIVEHRTHLPGE